MQRTAEHFAEHRDLVDRVSEIVGRTDQEANNAADRAAENTQEAVVSGLRSLVEADSQAIAQTIHRVAAVTAEELPHGTKQTAKKIGFHIADPLYRLQKSLLPSQAGQMLHNVI
ncbi:hypothetical protein BWR60_12730 [Inquilinus limosus]|uniref:Uncharacterized protein n=1 Tax=Inquilinus limosus TaxID=171674 RepID=A0A211ZND7_9PROT|nr:hypothetical protein BWR60_12730 [Inquilinus limosus]